MFNSLEHKKKFSNFIKLCDYGDIILVHSFSVLWDTVEAVSWNVNYALDKGKSIELSDIRCRLTRDDVLTSEEEFIEEHTR